MAWKDSKTTGGVRSCRGLPELQRERRRVTSTRCELCNGGSDSPCRRDVIEHVGFYVGRRHHPPVTPRSVISAAAGPRLLIRQVEYLLISQLTFISECSSPIRHLWTLLVACSSAPTSFSSPANSTNPLESLYRMLTTNSMRYKGEVSLQLY